MTLYALNTETLARISEAERSPAAPSAAQRHEYITEQLEARNGSVAGSVAQIDVKGVLTPQPDLISMLFGSGNTTYGSIIDALDRAAADSSIKSAVLNIDSPGGTVAGLFETLDAIARFPKPISSKASSALSAAYALASATQSVEATHPAATFGSVGVAASFYVDSRIVHLSSTASPKKRPNPKTPEGAADIREHLDAVHDLFAEAIASGRKTSVATVNERFGRGGVLLAAAAQKVGMIDSIASSPTKRKPTSASAQKVKAPMFAFSQLRSTNPELAAQLEAIAGDSAPALYNEIASEGFAEGYQEQLMAERARCVSHIECATRAGNTMLAYDAVESGAPFDADAVAGYTTRGAALPQYRGGRLVSEGTPIAAAPDVGDLVVAEMLRARGRTAEADAIAPAMPLAAAPRKMTDDELQEEIVRLMAQKGKGR